MAGGWLSAWRAAISLKGVTAKGRGSAGTALTRWIGQVTPVGWLLFALQNAAYVK